MNCLFLGERQCRELRDFEERVCGKSHKLSEKLSKQNNVYVNVKVKIYSLTVALSQCLSKKLFRIAIYHCVQINKFNASEEREREGEKRGEEEIERENKKHFCTYMGVDAKKASEGL